MRILKEYEVKLNIAPSELFTGSFSNSAYLLEYLKGKFEGRCKDTSFIVAIKKIIERSMITIDKGDLAGGGYLHVRFSAEAIIHTPGSVLVGCEVVNVEKRDMIQCTHEHAFVHIKGNKNFAPTKGDLVIVRVQQIGYPTDSNHMSIAGSPYYVQNAFPIKVVRPAKLGPTEKDLLSRKLAEIEDVRKQLAAADHDTVNFFEELFYPLLNKFYSVKRDSVVLDTAYEYSDITKLVSAVLDESSELTLGEPIAFSRHSAIPKFSPSVLILTIDQVRALKDSTDKFVDKAKFGTPSIAPSTFETALLELLDDYCEFLVVLIKCAEVFNTDKIRKAHQKIWTVYSLMKKA